MLNKVTKKLLNEAMKERLTYEGFLEEFAKDPYDFVCFRVSEFKEYTRLVVEQFLESELSVAEHHEQNL